MPVAAVVGAPGAEVTPRDHGIPGAAGIHQGTPGEATHPGAATVAIVAAGYTLAMRTYPFLSSSILFPQMS